MNVKTEFWVKRLIVNTISFFVEAIIAKALWNGVGHTLLNLPLVTYWQMLGLTIMVTMILPNNNTFVALVEKLVFDDKGNLR
jgi:hypothetical protein